MEPLTTVRTTATAGQEGRMIVDTGKGKKGYIKRYIANRFPGAKGGKTRQQFHDGSGGPGFDLTTNQGVAKAISDVNALSTRDQVLNTQVSKQLAPVGVSKKKTALKLSHVKSLIRASSKAPKSLIPKMPKTSFKLPKIKMTKTKLTKLPSMKALKIATNQKTQKNYKV